MNTADHLYTMAATFQDICQGEEPWVALGNFLNEWFDYAKDRRDELVAAPVSLLTSTRTLAPLGAVSRAGSKPASRTASGTVISSVARAAPVRPARTSAAAS